MKFRLRTLLGVIAIIAIVLAIRTLLLNVSSENRLIASQLANDIGSTFERNGTSPQGPILLKDDVTEQLEFTISTTATGELTNRWGQSILVTSILIGPGDPLVLELTVVSCGPFGCLGNCSVSETFKCDFVGCTEHNSYIYQ